VRISHRYRFIFLANPKTGSSSVRQFLDKFTDVHPAKNRVETGTDNPFYPHMRPEEVRDCFDGFGWEFGNYHRFVCVRNPWARLVSLYHHIHHGAPQPPPFEHWLYRVKPMGEGAGGQPWQSYGAYSLDAFIKDKRGSVLVDQVIRTERLNEDLLPYLRALGLPLAGRARIDHVNRSGQGARYTDFYTPRSAAHVERMYAYEVARFGYGFGDPA